MSSNAQSSNLRRTPSLVLPLALCLFTCEFALLYVDANVPQAESMIVLPLPVSAPMKTIMTNPSVTFVEPDCIEIRDPAEILAQGPPMDEADPPPPETHETVQRGLDARFFVANRAVKLLENQLLTEIGQGRWLRDQPSFWRTCDGLVNALTNGHVQPDFQSLENERYIGLKFVLPIGRQLASSQN